MHTATYPNGRASDSDDGTDLLGGCAIVNSGIYVPHDATQNVWWLLKNWRIVGFAYGMKPNGKLHSVSLQRIHCFMQINYAAAAGCRGY